MKTIHAFVFGVLLTMGAGVTYFGLGVDGTPAQAEAKPKKDVAPPARWQLLTKDSCVPCDFGFCNCK